METLREHWPEITGLVTIIIVALSLELIGADITPATIANCASLVAQVMATILGLLLTAYLVFHGMKIGETLKRRDFGSDEALTEIKVFLDDIHRSFIRTILLMCAGTLIPIAIFFAASLAGQVEMLQDSVARWFNNFSFALLLGIVVTAIANLIGAIRSLYFLKDIDD